jgi:dipeptidyl aminopeptidase/acylaminoacyl peptidase
MLQKITLLTASIVFTAFQISAQKKVIDHTAYNSWNRISESAISPDGNYTAYTSLPYKGDGYMYLVNNITGVKDSVARGKGMRFSSDGSYLVFKIAPQAEKLHKAELDKQKKEKWPKDSLGIWNIAKDSITKVPNITSFQLSEDGSTLAYLSNKNIEINPKELMKKSPVFASYYPEFNSKKALNKKAMLLYLKKTQMLPKGSTFSSTGTGLTIMNLNGGTKAEFLNVLSYEMNKTGSLVAFTEQRQLTYLKDKKEYPDSLRLFLYNTNEHKSWLDRNSYIEIDGIAFSEKNDKMLAMATNDTLAERKWMLMEYDTKTGAKTFIIDTNRTFENFTVLSQHRTPEYINNDRDIIFGAWEEAEEPVKDSLIEVEKANVDVWSWKDERIQPEQLVSIKSDETKNNPYVFHKSSNTFVQLGSDTLRILFPDDTKYSKLLAFSEARYRRNNWESPNANDAYIVDLETGKATLMHEKNYFDVQLSPSGNYFTYFDSKTNEYMFRDLKNGSENCITCGSSMNIMGDLNGMPMANSPLGAIGWTAKESGILIQAEHDILYYDIAKKSVSSITAFFRTEASDTNYNYVIYNLKEDSVLVYAENCILTRFDEKTKAMSVYRVEGNFPMATYTLLDASNHNYMAFRQGRNSKAVLYQKHSNMDYPDLYVSNAKGETARKLSNVNPQQSEYNWSTVELIKWKSYSGIPLEGLVYKPEDFDATKSYPLLVYFYEMYADEIHNHYAPKPTASIIYPTEYASAGYIVLIPDIRYTPGHPAQGAYDCIMSGTDAVLKMYPNIDSTRMGLQGQSWGGYQTAQLITMTNRYKAAMAGAPVSNMISAYGGIRWGSGFSRQFQYEHTQSRIGKTIWEAPELYIENSPLFHLPKVNTPLLVMANDKDGAVPWYQGIELYMGLRRLNKPVWMLNYVGDDHNLMKPANRMDLSIRMRQFFDYYLQGKEAPVWLSEGVPAIEKGSGIQYDITK